MEPRVFGFIGSFKNPDKTRTIASKAARASGWNYRKPFVFYIEVVAGVRFELTTFGL